MAKLNHKIPRPVEVIFSCQICYTPISEIYEEIDYDKGFRASNDSSSQQPVTKLWLGECCHLFCSKHLDGGGVPFHPLGQVPEASCPVCVTEKNDNSKRKLYGIRGCLDGQYDSQIPDMYFNTPPIRLESSGKGMDALRFQYLALARFATHASLKLRQTVSSNQEWKERHASAVSDQQEAENKVQALAVKVKELENAERDLHYWKQREPTIKYYLGIFRETMHENAHLRKQLESLDDVLPPRSIGPHTRGGQRNPPEDVLTSLLSHENELQASKRSTEDFANLQEHARTQQNTASSRTLSGPEMHHSLSRPTYNVHKDHRNHNTPSTKRYLDADASITYERAVKSPRLGTSDSRNLMPPPPLPSARRGSDTNKAQSGSNARPQSDEDIYRRMRRPTEGIFLRNDGTWERIPNSPGAGVTREGIQPHHESRIQSVHHDLDIGDEITPLNNEPSYNRNDINKQRSGSQERETTSLFEAQGLPVRQRGKHDDLLPITPLHTKRPDAHNLKSMRRLNDYNDIYEDVSYGEPQRSRQLREANIESTATARGYTPQNARTPIIEEPGRFNRYRWTQDVRPSPNGAHVLNSAQRSRIHQETPPPPYVQDDLRRNSSPLRKGNLTESVVSPFLRSSGAYEREGRLTFRNRTQLTSNSNPQYSSGRTEQQFSHVNSSFRPPMSGGVNSAGLLRMHDNVGVSVPSSPYFNHHNPRFRSSATNPVEFAADARIWSHSDTLYSNPSNYIGSSEKLAKSGPSRMSIEGKPLGRGSLGDYLAQTDWPNTSRVRKAQRTIRR